MDDLAAASAQVSDLQSRFDQLTRDLGPLEVKVVLTKEELGTITEETDKAKESLKVIRAEVTRRTNAYNEWRDKEIKRLDDKIVEVETAQKKLDNDKADFEATNLLIQEEFAAKQRQFNLSCSSQLQEIEELKSDVQEQVNANNRWAAQLTLLETALEIQKTEADKRDIELDERRTNIVRQEAEIEAKTVETNKAEQDTKAEREKARTLVKGLKERIANTDAREDAQAQERKMLDQKERELKDMKIGLDDRRNIMLSNGQL